MGTTNRNVALAALAAILTQHGGMPTTEGAPSTPPRIKGAYMTPDGARSGSGKGDRHRRGKRKAIRTRVSSRASHHYPGFAKRERNRRRKAAANKPGRRNPSLWGSMATYDPIGDLRAMYRMNERQAKEGYNGGSFD